MLAFFCFNFIFGDDVIVGHMAFDTVLNDASIWFDNNKITILANRTVDVNVTVNVEEGTVSKGKCEY